MYGAIITAIARIRLWAAHSCHQRLPRAEQQAASLQETVPSMEALTTPVKRNAQNVQQASPQAANASEVAHEASAVVS
ncbi:Methyl-accepting chemotaxis protein (plasmid) [Mycetohabitans rhizoxinica HKI 454]|uniref:Methyl-accepting chemotaxis protein n=1 Tax=Mycetohabitans rhizoxinica (strain DSM 19002 / CIP 109453 / HKI 454) TaxID=882378 RepID=E5AU16_MYCRK|nr:Methyl-accepting chemotaxis protein [Mycetohabitans rhizoxinica HKI 454]